MQRKRWYRQMTLEKANEIRRRYFAREKNQRHLSEEYGLKQHTISRIISGITWQ